MLIYPFNTPIILNDNIFSQYGGRPHETTKAQREAAYLIAEQKMSQYVGTLLLPHDISGSVSVDHSIKYANTDYGYVHQIYSARILDAHGGVVVDYDSLSNYVTIRNDTYGYFQLTQTWFSCNFPIYTPHTLEFVYRAGLPTGTASSPAMLSALTMSANIELAEMIGFPTANEGVGDVGIVEYETLDYREKRKPWKNTVFGASAKAAKIANLVDGSVKKARRSLVLGRV